MKKLLLFCGLLFFFGLAKADVRITNTYTKFFDKAYTVHPEIPRGMLEAVAFCNTRFSHLVHTEGEAESCSGVPKAYGVMGLTLDGKNYFFNNLQLVSDLSTISKSDIIADPEQNILAYAAAFAKAKTILGIKGTKVEDHLPIYTYLSELPRETAGQIFALITQEYGYVQFLTNSNYQQTFGFPDHHLNPSSIFGADNYEVLSSTYVDITGKNITNKSGTTFTTKSMMSADYPPALWTAASTSNYSVGRGGVLISAVTVHDVEGSYAGCISWFQNPSASVSAHYVARSSDGQITQMVLEANKAWHVGSENGYCIGIEHEGYASSGSWYTTAMYNSSAALVRDICASGYGINPLRTYYGPGCTGGYTSCLEGGCIDIKGHQMFPMQTHSDPGPYWNWYYYYEQINNTTPVTSYTTASGSFYDSGGPTGNYADDERQLFLINPAGATTVTLTVNSFDLEANWDYMYVYDGNSLSSPLIGTYTGTTIPTTIASTGGEMLIQFRSDCSTVNPGWNFSWSSSAPPVLAPTGMSALTATCPNINVNLSWTNTGAGWFMDVSTDPTFATFYNKDVSGLTSVTCPGGFCEYPGCASYLKFKPSTTYYWRIWNGSVLTNGASFTTPTCISSDVNCTGTFEDTGGASAAYTGSEDYTYTIAPTSALNVTMNFTSFNLENGFDSLYIYDGNTIAAPLIGGYTGSTSPGTFTSTANAITLRFISDPFTNNAGFTSSWTCSMLSTGVDAASSGNEFNVYPNPFTNLATLAYTLTSVADVKISLCDVLGKEITLQQTEQSSGKHELTINSTELGLAKGMYIVKLKMNDDQRTVKLILR